MFTKPDGTTTDSFDDCHNAWQQFAAPIIDALNENEDDGMQMELMTGGPNGVALISPDYKRQVNLPPWFIRWLNRLLDDHARLAAQLADARRTAQAIMESGGLHEDCAKCAVVEWLARVAGVDHG